MDDKNVVLRLLPPSTVDKLWPWISDYVGNIAERSGGQINPQHVKAGGVSGDIWIWVAVDKTSGRAIAVLLGMIEDWNGALTVRVLGMWSDNSKSWRSITKDWEEDLASRGVTKIHAVGRPGFGRLFGYKPTGHIVMEKNIDAGRQQDDNDSPEQ